MSRKKRKGRKERLEPLFFYRHDPKDVIRAFMQVDPEELKSLKEEEQLQWESEQDRGQEENP